MLQIVYKDSADQLTLEQVIKAHEAGISIAVNDGKDLTISIEKEDKGYITN